MSLLSRVFNLAINLIHLPFTVTDGENGIARNDALFFPFDTLRNMQEPCSSMLLALGENELKVSALPRGFCANCCPVKASRDIRFVFYSKTQSKHGAVIEPFQRGAARRVGVDTFLPTVIFIHGFTEASPGQSGQEIRDAYLSKRENFNVILLDWSELATFPWYQVAVVNVKHVAQRLREFIEIFNDSGEIPIQNLHVIGFSLGCHIAGIAGKLLRKDLRIPRITGLDPALPEFSLKDISKRLNSNDAEYVDVIHTDSGIFGFPLSVGHADFYPNGGRALQPGCQPSYLVRQRIVDQVLACSHVRAWRLYAESVRNERAFPATRCTVWRGSDKHCNFSVDAYMGYVNTPRTRGSFYLITHESKPYGVRR
ncbi:lipoprotein lipase [Leptinotarsa decemlineata]|uniref:lipoprotein lipase n=1 Tax=Leptinotarsa decemlineata TaxID=7539 RepID=UPI003D30B04A